MTSAKAISALSNLLLRNGFTDVDHAVAKVLDATTQDSQVLSSVSKLKGVLPSDFIARNKTSRTHVARLIVAQAGKDAALRESFAANYTLRPPDAIVFVATDLEYRAISELLSSPSSALDGQGHWRTEGVTSSGNLIAVIKTGQGNVLSGAITSRVLATSEPKVVIFMGVAGGLHRQDIGAVVIASHIHDYESAEASAQLKSRAKSLPVDFKLTQVSGGLIATGVDGVSDISLRPIASGEKLITSSDNDISQWLDTVASDAAVIEMEGLGFMRAAQVQNVAATVVRGVSDRRDDKSSEQDRSAQPVAANAAARVTVQLIDLYLLNT